jgi:hypothetical protein
MDYTVGHLKNMRKFILENQKYKTGLSRFLKIAIILSCIGLLNSSVAIAKSKIQYIDESVDQSPSDSNKSNIKAPSDEVEERLRRILSGQRYYCSFSFSSSWSICQEQTDFSGVSYSSDGEVLLLILENHYFWESSNELSSNIEKIEDSTLRRLFILYILSKDDSPLATRILIDFMDSSETLINRQTAAAVLGHPNHIRNLINHDLLEILDLFRNEEDVVVKHILYLLLHEIITDEEFLRNTLNSIRRSSSNFPDMTTELLDFHELLEVLRDPDVIAVFSSREEDNLESYRDTYMCTEKEVESGIGDYLYLNICSAVDSIRPYLIEVQ